VNENEKERGMKEENKIPRVKDRPKKRKGKDIAKNN